MQFHELIPKYEFLKAESPLGEPEDSARLEAELSITPQITSQKLFQLMSDSLPKD